MKTKLNTLVAFILVCSGCASVDKMIDHGNFDQALNKSIRKIAGDQQLKRKYVLAIEDAFLKATVQDLSDIETLKLGETADRWKQIIKILERLDLRQNSVKRLTPLIAKDGYLASFEFVEITDHLKEAIDQFVHFRYRESLTLVELARRGDKESARIAYSLLDEIWDFRSTYLDASLLQSEARELGIQHISISIDNNTGHHIPQELSDEILYSNFENDQWVQYHYTDEEYNDRRIKIVLADLEFSPERLGERNFSESKRIEDGYRYVLDENGNVAKDSLGNDIKERNRKMVRAQATEIHQTKSAVIFGKIIIRDHMHAHMKAVDFDSEVVFDHKSLTFSGDPRALSSESRELLEYAIVPFPANNQMIYDLMRSLRSVIRSKISRKDLQV